MPRIRCRYEDCIFLEAGFCSAERIELDPETGCLTYQQADEAVAEEAWVEDEDTEVLDAEEEEEEEIEWEDEEDDEEDDDEEEW